MVESYPHGRGGVQVYFVGREEGMEGMRGEGGREREKEVHSATSSKRRGEMAAGCWVGPQGAGTQGAVQNTNSISHHM